MTRASQLPSGAVARPNSVGSSLPTQKGQLARCDGRAGRSLAAARKSFGFCERPGAMITQSRVIGLKRISDMAGGVGLWADYDRLWGFRGTKAAA